MSAPEETQFVTRPIAELLGRNPGYGFAGFGVSTAIGNYTDSVVDLGFPSGLLGLLDLTRTGTHLHPEPGGRLPAAAGHPGRPDPARGRQLHARLRPTTVLDCSVNSPRECGHGGQRLAEAFDDLAHRSDLVRAVRPGL